MAHKPKSYFFAKLMANLSPRPQDSEELSRGLGLTHQQVVHSMRLVVQKGLATRYGKRANLKWSLPPQYGQGALPLPPVPLAPVLSRTELAPQAAPRTAASRGSVQALIDMDGDFVLCKGGVSLHLTADEAKQVSSFFARFL